jgi:hypothetical protein
VHRVHAARGAHGARVAQGLEAAECQHHPRAGHHVALGEGQGLLDFTAAEHQDHLVAQVFEALVRPGNKLGAALRRHLHTVRHLEGVPRQGGGLFRRQPGDGRGHVGGRRVAVVELAVRRFAPRDHEIAEFLRRAAGGGTLQRVHVGKHGVDAL